MDIYSIAIGAFALSRHTELTVRAAAHPRRLGGPNHATGTFDAGTSVLTAEASGRLTGSTLTMITVWRVPLDGPELLTPERLSWLSREETMRADSFRDALGAQRWRIAHIALREILGATVGIAPGLLRFGAGDGGKPFLWLSGGPTFNLSHADDLALVAIGGPTQIGVDVEFARPTPDLREIAASHFSPEERAVIEGLSDIAMVDCFYRCWTRKEAYVKALGTGIGHDLTSFAVSLGEVTTRVLHERGNAARGAEWTLRDLALTFPYVGALAARAPRVEVQVLQWSAR